jgi:hypothetical protein
VDASSVHVPASHRLPMPPHELRPVQAIEHDVPVQETPFPHELMPVQQMAVFAAWLAMPPAQAPVAVHATWHVPVPVQSTAPLQDPMPEQVTAHALEPQAILP